MEHTSYIRKIVHSLSFFFVNHKARQCIHFEYWFPASGDYTIPSGCTVVVTTFKMHRQPQIYPNPEVFNPDNFLPEKTANRHYYAFVPFSAGPRSCVGRKYAMLKLKIILSTVLRNFRVKSDIKESDFRLQADIILKRAEGFKIRMEPRKPAAATA